MQTARLALLTAGGGLFAGAAVHVVAMLSGPDLIAALGAPPEIVRSATDGSSLAPTVIYAIAFLLAVVGACAFSVAGRMRPIPLARPVLYAMAAILLLRAMALPLMLAAVPQARSQAGMFDVSTALLCAVLGALLLIGVRGVKAQTRVIGA